MNVIGLNFNHSDTSACLIIDNNLIAAAEENDLIELNTPMLFQNNQLNIV